MPTSRTTWLRALWIPLFCAISVSIAPTAQDFSRIPPQYPDARTIRLFGTITVTLTARGTVREAEDTTATVSVRAQQIIEYTPEGSTTRLSATGRATAVTKHPESTERENTTYTLDPEDRERRSPGDTVRGLEMLASLERQAGYFSIDQWTIGVQSHTTVTTSEGGRLTTDVPLTWHIRVPNHTRESAPLEAAADDAVTLGGFVEVPGADGRTTGSHTVPILFGRVFGADTPPMLKKLGMLDGEYPGFVPGTITVTWALAPEAPDTEAVFELTDTAYDQWRPWPGPDENTAGDTLTFFARIHKRDEPDEPASQRATFKFELTDVTKEPGVCMNWPTARPQPAPQFDLRIEQARNPELRLESTQVAKSKDGLESAEVVVSSFDGAAWGRLRVTAILDDGTEVPAHLKDDRSVSALTIPKDDGDNHISDVWEKNFGVAGSDDSADEDATPPPAEHPGDGFSNYEEYRGFWVQGEFVSTNPNIKDLFIHDAANLGIGVFGVAGLAVHLVKEEEYGQEGGDANHNPNVVNGNRGRATRGPQHLLKMVNEHLADAYGEGTGDTIGSPALTPLVRIDVTRGQNAAAEFQLGPEFLAWVIAHELAHGCSIRHHGSGDYPVSAVGMSQAPDGSGGAPLAPEKAFVAAIGGQHSGATDCIMRYFTGPNYYERPAGGAFFWQTPSGGIRSGDLYFVGKPGTSLCLTKGAGRAQVGDALVGECRNQLNVNDNPKQ
jgi:hypothetical protein